MSLYFISFYEFWKPSVLAQLDKTHLKWSNSSIWNKGKNTLLKSWGWKHAPSKLKPHTIQSMNEFTSCSHVQAHNLKRWVSLWQEERRARSLYISPQLSPPWTASTRYHMATGRHAQMCLCQWTVQNFFFLREIHESCS